MRTRRYHLLIARLRWLAYGLSAVVLTSEAKGQVDPDQSNSNEPENNLQQLTEMPNQIEDLLEPLGDWSRQAPLISDAIIQVWNQNEWNTEADLFARNTILQLSKIPPWKFQQRLQTLSQAARNRYGLTDRQAQQFNEILHQESWQMGMKYLPFIMKHGFEAIAARQKGLPFTADQVAQWEKNFDPMIPSLQEDLEKITGRFSSLLTPNQKAIWERDLESIHKRMNYYLTAREKWKLGQWTPLDWGLHNDPLHQQAIEQLMQLALTQKLLTGVNAHDENTWSRYVLAFIRYYDLDQSQQTSCHSMLNDLVNRANQFRQTQQKNIQKLASAQQVSHPLLGPIRAMFEELKSRLELIPTESQREKAKKKTSILPPDPTSSINPAPR